MYPKDHHEAETIKDTNRLFDRWLTANTTTENGICYCAVESLARQNTVGQVEVASFLPHGAPGVWMVKIGTIHPNGTRLWTVRVKDKVARDE